MWWYLWCYIAFAYLIFDIWICLEHQPLCSAEFLCKWVVLVKKMNSSSETAKSYNKEQNSCSNKYNESFANFVSVLSSSKIHNDNFLSLFTEIPDRATGVYLQRNHRVAYDQLKASLWQVTGELQSHSFWEAHTGW